MLSSPLDGITAFLVGWSRIDVCPLGNQQLSQLDMSADGNALEGGDSGVYTRLGIDIGAVFEQVLYHLHIWLRVRHCSLQSGPPAFISGRLINVGSVCYKKFDSIELAPLCCQLKRGPIFLLDVVVAG